MTDIRETNRLNPEPTDAQWAAYHKHKSRGTTPGNPKWYKPRTIGKRVEFVPGRPPVYPRIESGADWNLNNSHTSAKVLGESVKTRYIEYHATASAIRRHQGAFLFAWRHTPSAKLTTGR